VKDYKIIAVVDSAKTFSLTDVSFCLA